MTREETETDLSVPDWWGIGYADGLYGLDNPPEERQRADAYREGREVGERERKQEDALRATAPATNPEDIPL